MESKCKKDCSPLLLLVLSTSLNHWLAGSHVLSLLMHLQLFVTIALLEPTSRQMDLPFLSLDERCILESAIISHFEFESLQKIPSFASVPDTSACKQK